MISEVIDGSLGDYEDGEDEDEYVRMIIDNIDFITFLISLALLIPCLFSFFNRLFNRNWIFNIHPEHVDNVNEFRLSEEQIERRNNAAKQRIEEAKNSDENECPICLSSGSFLVYTDCGHVFCCSCIIGYWQKTQLVVNPVNCAICRSVIHMLLPLNWKVDEPGEDHDHQGSSESNQSEHSEPRQSQSEEDMQECNKKINDYNRRFSTNRKVIDYIRDIPILVPYLIRNFLNNDILTIMYRLRIAVVLISILIYIVLPSDILPENTMGIVGFLDDCVVGLLVFGFLARWFRHFMANRGDDPEFDDVDEEDEFADDLVFDE